jgi:hypothetical protein
MSGANARGSDRLLVSTRFALGAGFGGLFPTYHLQPTAY